MKLKKILLPIFIGATLLMASFITVVSGIDGGKNNRRTMANAEQTLKENLYQESIVSATADSDNLFEIVTYDGLVYDGSEKTLMTITPIAGSVYYKVLDGEYSSSDAITSSTYSSCSSGTTGSTITITKTDAGTYTVYYYVPAGTYNSVAYSEVSASKTITIDEPKGNAYCTAGVVQGATYTGSAVKIMTLTPSDGTTMYYTVELDTVSLGLQTDEEALEYYTNLLKTSPTSYSSTTTSVDISVTNAGDYTVYYYIPETDEYLEASGAVSGTLENLTSTVNFTLNNGYWSEGMSSNDATSVGEIGSSVSVGQVEQEGYEYTGWSEDTLSPVTLENEVKTFNGTSDYIDLGTNYKYADKLFVSIEAYMADWSQMAWSDRLISCTEGGGWNFEMTNGGDGIMFTAKDSGASYKYAKSTTKWSDLSAGWHTFVGSFDGDYLRFYIDGELKGVSENFVGQIGYNSSNSIIVGAEAGSSTGVQSTAPGYFEGKIRNVYIANTCVTASSIISHTPDDTYGYPTIYIFEDVYSWLDILAQWSANTYYIKYDAKGGTGTMSNQAVTYGATVALKTNAYSMTNFEFAGWTTSDYDLSEIPTIDYEEGAEICNLTSENGAIITLYAVWLSEYYNAQIFEMATNGSYPSTASSTKTLAARAGTTLTLADVVEAQNLVPDGFSYDYAKDASGNTITTVTVANNNATVVKFYMKRATYNLYLDGNGGDCEGAYGETYLQRYYGQAYGEDINTYFIVDRKGYTFSGWFTDATGGTQVSTTTTMGIGDTTIYAHWTANTYTVTFDANGGTVSTTSETVTFDSTYGTLPTPTKPGYRFDGWTINYINVNDLVEAFEKILSIQGCTYIISEDVVAIKKEIGSGIAYYPLWGREEATHRLSAYVYTDGSSENGATLIGSFEFDYGNGGEICISITGASSTRQYYSSTYNNASLDAYLSMTISNGGEANETYFEDLRLEVIDANGNVAYITSSSNVIDTTNHVLEANWTAIAPTINIETTTNTVAYGVNDAILTANAVHDLAKTYQWYCSTTSGFTPDSSNAIVGAIDETYTHEATSKNVGTYYYKCIVTANGLSTTSNEITITVSKADIILTPTINNGLEYNGSAQVLMSLTDNDGIPNNIYYKVGTELTSSNYSTTGSTSLPTGTEAGDYNVYFYIPTSTNYNAISGKVLVSIAKAENVITVVTKQNLEYTGSAIALLESATDENDDADGVIYYNVGTKLTSSNYSSAGSTTMPTVTNAGEHIIYMYVPETDNYKEVSGVAVVNIDKTSNLITPKPATGLVYNGTYQTLLTVTDNNDVSNDIYYSIGTELDADNLTDYGSKDLPTAKNSGTYVVYFYIPETTNYKLISGFCEVTIDYLETTLTINPNGGYWGGTTSNSTFTQVNGTTLRVDNPTRAGYTFTDWDFVATELADGAILTFAGLENNVYTFDVGNITLTAKWEAIVPTVSISIDKTSIVYGSETATLTATCEHELAITYQWHRSTTSGFTPSSTTALGGGVNAVYTHNKLATNAGTYYYKCVVTVNGMTATSSQVQLVVEKLNNSFETILDQNLVYNGQPQTLVEVVDNDGIDNNVYYSVGTKLTSSNYSTSGSKTVPTETNAGDYIVYFYVPTSDNYNELSGKIPVSIAMADNTFELIRYQGLVYNAQSQTLAQVIDNDGIDNNVYYRVVNVNEDTGDMKLNSTNYKDNGTTNLPSAIYSGKYNIYFYVPASDNFNELSGVTQGEIATKYTTLTVNPNGGIWNGSAGLSTFTEGDGVTKTIQNPTRAGYTFSGWTATDGALFENNVFTFGIIDVTLTAEWDAIPPTITISTDTNSIVYGSEQATLTAVAVHDLPKTYQWYRSTTSGFTPSSDNAISGATATTYIHGETETNVGTYYYKCIVTANGLTATSNAVTITVTKAETYVTINSQQSLMYNGEDQVLLEVVINNATDDRQVYYAIDTDLTDSNYGTAGSTDLPTRKNAGKYNVSFYIPSNNNFNALQGSLLVEIAKLSNGVQLVEATDLVYDGTDHVLLQVTDRDETEDNVYYSIGTELKENGSTSLPTGKNAGTYKVYFYVPETTNYNSISGSATINIARAENMLVVKAKQDLLYTGSAQELIEVSNTENLEESVYFSIGTELDSTNYKANGTTTIPSATNVGTYSIYFYVPQSTNYDALGGGVEAVIEVKYTTLTVNPNGGTWGGTTNNSTFTEGNGTTKTIADATREGYSFTGWTFTGGGTWNDETNVFTFGASDAILMAVWDGLMYQVSYNGNGATSGQMSNSTHTYDVEQALSENQYSRTGYTFSGWATAANGTMAYEDKALVKNLATSGTFELFAVWTANTYEVSYNGNGATSGQMSNSSHTYDVDKALTTNAYSKTGYDFSGWATTSTGTKVYDNNEVVKNLTTEGTYELFAIWTASQYTVSFNTNGGSAVNNITVTYDSDYGDLPETTKNGYTFAGWFLESGFATEVTDTTIVKTASNHTLYAKWTINPYTITLDYNGGTDNFLLTSSGQLTLSGTAEFSETYHGVSGVEDTTEAKFNGSKSIKVSDLGCFVGSDVAGKYKLSAYLMYNGTGSIQVEGYAEDVTTYDMVGSDTVTLPSGIWVYMSFEYTLTDGSAGNWCNIIFENITDSSSYYIDDIKVRRIDTYNPKTTYNYNIESGAMELPYAVKDGYTFIGWSTDKNATTGIMTHVAGQTGNVTYYAIYKLSNPTATTSADNATIIYNGTDNATLTATVNTEGVAMDSIAYQWYRDGVAIDGATSATYTHTSNALDVGTYTYYCKVTTTKGTETSSEIQSTSTTITVQQATTTIDITMSDYVYAGEISTPTGTTNSDCGDSAITFYCNTTGVASGGTKWTNMTSTSLNVGTYYIYATTPATTNYKAGVSDVVEFKVTEATIELDYMADSNAGLTEDGYNIEYSSGLDEDGLTVKIGPANTDATIAYWIGTGEKTTETVSKGNMLTLPTLNNADTIIYNYTVTAPNYTTITGTITLKITKGTTAVVWEIEDAYTYDGTDQSASVKAHIVGVDGNDIDCDISFTINDESVEFKNAGTYTVTATLTGNEASNYNLTNDTQSITIDRLAIVITAANKSMTYGGTAPEYTCSASVVAPDSYTVSYTLYKETINGGSTELTEITGDLSTLDVGTYKITPSSNLSTTNYNVTYENGTLTISPKQLAKPYVIGTYTYNRTAQTVQLDNFDTNTMEIVSGNTGTDADAYTVVIKLKDSANYTWNDGTIANVELNWTIAKYDLSGATIATIPQQPFTGSAVEPKPQVTALGATLVDGTDFTYDYENNINAGTQAVVIINAVENSNYTGTNSANFTIAGAFIEIPTVSGTYIYNGAEQTVVLNGFDSSTMEIVSGNKGTNADTYTVEIALTNSVNYTWATGSKENITLDWTIAKADVTLGLESDNILVRVGDSATNKATITLDYSGNLDGQSLTTTGGSANANITTSAISNNVSTITITPTKSMTGTETITVIYDGDTNHNEASATFTLEIPAIKVEIVVSGSGSGTLSNTIEGSTDEVELNSDITFTATPSTNYGLAKYTVGTENTTYITSSTDLTAVFSKEINVTDNLLTDSDSDGIKDKLTINLYFEEVITLDITNEGDAGSISNDFITKYENNEVAHIYADNKLTTFKNSTIGLDVEAKKVGDQYYVVNEITVDGESTTINLLNTTTSIDSDASSVSIKSAKVYNADNRQITDGTKNIATVSVEVKQNYNAVTIEDSKYVVENSAVNFVITETNSDYDFLGIRRSIVNESGEIEYVNVLRDQLNSSEWNISTNTDNQTVRTWTEQSFTESLSEAEPLMLERWYEVNNTKNRTVEVTIDSGVSAKLVNTDIGYSYTLATDIFNEGTDALYAGGWMVVIDSTTTNISNYDVSIQVYTSGSDTPTEYGKDAQFTIDSNVTKVVISITNLSTSTSTTIE